MSQKEKPLYSTGKPDHRRNHCQACGSIEYREKTVPLPEPLQHGKAIASHESRFTCLKCNHVWSYPQFTC